VSVLIPQDSSITHVVEKEFKLLIHSRSKITQNTVVCRENMTPIYLVKLQFITCGQQTRVCNALLLEKLGFGLACF